MPPSSCRESFARYWNWTRRHPHILTLLFFSFGYVMVTCIVPDHFVISMMLLILALYVSGRRIKHNHPLKIWQTVVYFVLTAGTSLNNGLKIFFSAFFVNGKRFFRPKHLLLAVILPAALLWGFCRWEYRTFVWPVEMARKETESQEGGREESPTGAYGTTQADTRIR